MHTLSDISGWGTVTSGRGSVTLGWCDGWESCRYSLSSGFLVLENMALRFSKKPGSSPLYLELLSCLL